MEEQGKRERVMDNGDSHIAYWSGVLYVLDWCVVCTGLVCCMYWTGVLYVLDWYVVCTGLVCCVYWLVCCVYWTGVLCVLAGMLCVLDWCVVCTGLVCCMYWTGVLCVLDWCVVCTGLTSPVHTYSLMHKVLALCCSRFHIKSCFQVCLELFPWR